MTRSLIIVVAATALLGACSQQKEKASPAAEPQAAAPSVATRDEPIALGLTAAQLEGANLLSPDGLDLGDVERVDINSEGKATGLIVAPTGTGERWVRLPLDGLTTKSEGRTYIVVAPMTFDQIKALPPWTP